MRAAEVHVRLDDNWTTKSGPQANGSASAECGSDARAAASPGRRAERVRSRPWRCPRVLHRHKKLQRLPSLRAACTRRPRSGAARHPRERCEQPSLEATARTAAVRAPHAPDPAKVRRQATGGLRERAAGSGWKTRTDSARGCATGSSPASSLTALCASLVLGAHVSEPDPIRSAATTPNCGTGGTGADHEPV